MCSNCILGGQMLMSAKQIKDEEREGHALTGGLSRLEHHPVQQKNSYEFLKNMEIVSSRSLRTLDHQLCELCWSLN